MSLLLSLRRWILPRMEDNLIINSQKLTYVSAYPEITIADSFVKRANKIGSASGEAKLYIGPDSFELWDFFGPPNFEIECFILKSNLISIHDTLKKEYFSPSQKYRHSSQEILKNLWVSRSKEISEYGDIIQFDVFEQAQIRGNRIYIKSESKVFSFIREICLPNLTKLKIQKFMNPLGHHYFNFSLIPNY